MAKVEQRPGTRDTVVVIDFGAQSSQLIVRRVREAHVYCELWPHTKSLEALVEAGVKGVILSGSPASVGDQDAPGYSSRLFELDIPVLGIGYGMHLMANVLGGSVEASRETGKASARIVADDPLFKGIEAGELECWLSPDERVGQLPPDFDVLASTAETPIAVMRSRTKPWYGLQFYPEVDLTPQGAQILRNFVVDVCGCTPSWTMDHFIDEAVEAIRRQVGDERVICALSGGVDSSVAAALVYRAVGDQLTSVFVDHGLLRKGEAQQVIRTFTERFGSGFVAVDARERFLKRLAGVIDPETKRKAIGNEFIRIFEEEARKVGNVRFLVQGTLYPDVIESGFGASATIKSHHNVGGLPEDMALELVEPLKYLFKDEVRALGEALGLPKDIVWRQPFPGPGLAIRVMGAVDAQRLDIEREADAIVVEEIARSGLEDEVWQYFAVLLNTRSVGVFADDRTYGYVVAVRAVTGTDGMTAQWARLPHDLLDRIGQRIMTEVPQVSRVVYDISSKPPATIEWE